MAERTLRGARLGGQSFEDERGIEFAARQQVGYRCPQGHEFEITMSVEADIPAVWECPRCGAEALSTSGIEREVKAEKPVRTHWDMLLERRSEKELEDILKERLELLRGGEIGPAHLHRANAKKRKARPEPSTAATATSHDRRRYASRSLDRLVVRRTTGALVVVDASARTPGPCGPVRADARRRAGDRRRGQQPPDERPGERQDQQDPERRR